MLSVEQYLFQWPDTHWTWIWICTVHSKTALWILASLNSVWSKHLYFSFCFYLNNLQFHYAVFFAYIRLREQEIRNLMWISECVAQNQKSRVHDSVVFIFWVLQSNVKKFILKDLCERLSIFHRWMNVESPGSYTISLSAPPTITCNLPAQTTAGKKNCCTLNKLCTVIPCSLQVLRHVLYWSNFE